MQFSSCHVRNVHCCYDDHGDGHGEGKGNSSADSHFVAQLGDSRNHADAHNYDDHDAHIVLGKKQGSSVDYRDLPTLAVIVVGIGLGLAWEKKHQMES